MKTRKLKFFKLMFLGMVASWISQEKSDVIEYLLEANKILKAKLESNGKRIRYTDAERARLARKGRKLSWKAFSEVFLCIDS